MSVFLKNSKKGISSYKKSFFLAIFAGLLVFTLTASYVYADYYAWTERSGSGYTNDWKGVTSSQDGTTLYAVRTNDYIHKSTDSGANWSPLGGSGTRNWISIDTSSDGQIIIAVVEDGFIYFSVDGGANWTQTGVSGLWKSAAISSNGLVMAAASSGGIYVSSDQGQNWSSGSGEGDWRSVDVSSDGSKMVAAINGGYIFTSSNTGSTWAVQSAPGALNWIAVTSSADGTKLAAAVNGGYIYTSVDSGTNWVASATSMGTQQWISVTSSSNGMKIAAAADSGAVYSSVDGGSNWTQEVSAGSSRTWRSIVLSADGADILAASSDSYLYTGLDNVAPTILSVTSDTANGSYNEGDVIDIDVIFSEPVTSSDGVTVMLETGSDDRTCTFSVTSTTTGTCNYTVQAGDISGGGTSDTQLDTLSVFISMGDIVDAAGNVLSDFTPAADLSVNKLIIIDTSTPAAPDAPDLDSDSDSGTYSNDNITNDAAPTITTSCETDTNVVLSDDGTPFASGTCVNGSMSVTASLSEGAHTIRAVQTDLAGNVSPESVGSLSLLIDVTPPTTSGAPDMTPDTDHGSTTDNTTNDTTPTFTGVCTNGNTVQLYVSGASSGSSATCASSVFSLTSDTMTAGNKSITFKETDPAGNISSASTALSMAIDLTPPTVSLTAPSSGATVTGAAVTISATASVVFGVQFKRDTNTLIGSEDTVSPYSVTWDTTALSDGSQTLIAVAQDRAGNYATSTSRTVTIDNTAPSISSISAGSLATTGATITWSTNEAASSSISYGLTTSYGTVSTSSATSTHSVSLTGLTTGTTYHYRVLAIDSSGNISTSSDATFTTTAESVGGFGTVYNNGVAGGGAPLTITSTTGGTGTSTATSTATSSLSANQTSTSTSSSATALCPKGYVCSPNASTTTTSNSRPGTATSSARIFTFTRDLYLRLINEDVRYLQRLLNSIGFIVSSRGPGSKGNETNIFGPATKAALAKFQKSALISPSVGYFGSVTRNYVNRFFGEFVGR